MYLKIYCPFKKIKILSNDNIDYKFMKKAYNIAINGWKNNEIPIGAIITFDNKIIASSYNKTCKTNNPLKHAELIVINKASSTIKDWRLNNMNLYVTKEPCLMCAGAILRSRIKKIIFGCCDKKMGFFGGCYNINNISTLNHYIGVKSGILENKCKNLLKSFFSRKRIK